MKQLEGIIKTAPSLSWTMKFYQWKAQRFLCTLKVIKTTKKSYLGKWRRRLWQMGRRRDGGVGQRGEREVRRIKM